jgi:AraC-like DNA-binding protein
VSELYRTRDPDEAAAAISDAYAPATLEPHGRSRDFVLDLQLSRLPGMNVGRTAFGTDVQILAPPRPCYVVCFAPHGCLDVGRGREGRTITGPRGSVIHSDELAWFERWSPDCELVSIRIDHTELERKLTQLLGHAPNQVIQFDLAFRFDDPAKASLVRALTLLQAECAQPAGLLTNTPAAAATVTDLVVTSLLLSQPNDFSERLARPAKPSPPNTIHAARELIETEPMRISSVGQLAEAVHTSIRSLEEGFARHIGMPPMTYLRQVKLNRVRTDLLAATPGECTTANIAQRWGFTHYGRFASAYRALYNEGPAQTLRTSRRR